MNQITSMHQGVPDKLLTTVSPQNKLSAQMAASISTLHVKLLEPNLSSDERINILSELVTIATKHRPRNFQEYLWYTSFTTALILIQDLPLSFCVHKSKMIMHTFQTPTELWDACPIKIHLVARSLFAMLDDDYNLVFVVKQICNLNRLSYYVAVSLVWAALYRHTKQTTNMFRMHKISDLVQLLGSIDITQKHIENNLDDMHRLLTLISVFQSLVILRKPRHEEYVCFRSFFKVSHADLKSISDWLEELKKMAEYIASQNVMNEECLQIIEMLDLDILHFMEQKLNQELQGDAYDI